MEINKYFPMSPLIVSFIRWVKDQDSTFEQRVRFLGHLSAPPVDEIDVPGVAWPWTKEWFLDLPSDYFDTLGFDQSVTNLVRILKWKIPPAVSRGTAKVDDYPIMLYKTEDEDV